MSICEKEEKQIKIQSVIIIKYNERAQLHNDCFLCYYLNPENQKIFRVLVDDKIMEFVFKSIKETIENNHQINLEVENGSIILFFIDEKDFSEFNDWLSENIKRNWRLGNNEKSLEVKKLLGEMVEDSFFVRMRMNPKIGIDSKTFLSNELKNMIDKYKHNSYYGPFSVICQSSGFGKSRVCASLTENNFYVVFCCLRPKESTGYPKRSILAEKLTSKNTDLKYFRCYFSLFIELLNKTEDDCKQFFEKYDQQENKSSSKHLEELINENYKKFTKKSKITKYCGTKPLLFVFDEASNLCVARDEGSSNFFLIRSILSELKDNMFVLFLDTFTQLSEFMPFIFNDPSSRIHSGKKKIFDPIYLLPNWDLFVDTKNISSVQKSVKFENICMFGRPLWGSWMFTRKNSNGKYDSIDFKELYDLAASKLIGGKDLDSELNENDCLALLSCRIGAIKPKCLSTSQEMVAKNMAVCTYVDKENGIFEIDYPSEPILSEAAAYLMNKKQNLELCIEKLVFMVESSLISQGNKGEIIAKLLLIIAQDASSHYIEPCYPLKFSKVSCVGEFIKSLYGRCVDKDNNDVCGNIENSWTCSLKKETCCIEMIKSQIENANQILSGFINFNHFTKAKENMNKTSLLTALKRCAAFHCKYGQKVIDLVIPVSLNIDNFDSISVVVIQVKLVNEPNEPKYSKIEEKFDPGLFLDFSKDVPFVFLYMQLGAPKNKVPYIKNIKDKNSVDPNSQYIAIIYSQGISREIFPIINKSLEQKMLAFADSNEKLFKIKDDVTKVKIYNTIRFI